MKNMLFFVSLLIQVFLVFDMTKAKKAFKRDPETIKFSELNRKCKAECSKLSKVYPCFCDLSCLEYGDCCKLFAKGCENYFDKLLNHSKLVKHNKNNKNHQVVLLSNNKNNTQAFKDGIKNFINHNNTFEKSEVDGKCCYDSIEPFNCFCDLQCSINGDCCSDYSYCINNNFISEKKVNLFARKRNLLDNSGIQRKNFIKNNKDDKIKNHENIEANNGNDNNDISFKFMKRLLYEKLGIKQSNRTNFDIWTTNITKSEEKAGIGKKLGLYKVNTLTPQIGIKYLNKTEDYSKNITKISDFDKHNIKNARLINYDFILMKKAPVAAKITISN